MSDAQPPNLSDLDLHLQQALLTGGEREHDRLQLSDAVLQAALNGSRPLRAQELRVLKSSPLTMRRFKLLARQARQAGVFQSHGQLLAASSEADSFHLQSTDQCWQLQFFRQQQSWRMVLRLLPEAGLDWQQKVWHSLIQVCASDGSPLLRGRLDQDGELEQAWPYTEAPLSYLQQHGNGFTLRWQD